MLRFILDHFVNEYDPTIEDSYRKQFRVDSGLVMFDILDTAGTEEYSAMREQYMRRSDGFILMFSLTSKESLLELKDFPASISRIQDYRSYDVPISMP